MLKIALKATLARKLRLFSTALAVILGVAFLAGTLVFTDTIKRTFDDLFADVFEGTDTYVRSEMSIDLEFGESLRSRIPGSVADIVGAVPGVADVEPLVQGFAQPVDHDGNAIGNPGTGAPTVGMSYSGSAGLSQWNLTAGSRAPGPDELVLDKATADRNGLEIGDLVTVMTQTGPHRFPLVGTARFGSVDSPGGANISLFDLETAQRIFVGGADELDAVLAHAEPGVGEDELTALIAAVLPDGIEAVTGTFIVDETQDLIGEMLGFFNTFLLVFAGIGLVVACFTIYNTFQISITQRTKEMALLRSVGATRGQVLRAQLLEAGVIGTVASIAGLAAGVAIAAGLKAMMNTFGVDLPAGGTVFAVRTVVVGLVVGVVVTIVAAVFPARRASRVPPLAAMRDVSVDTSGQSRHRLVSGGLVTAAGLAVFAVGLFRPIVQLVGIGALGTFVGVFMLGPLIARPVARVIGSPLPPLVGVTGSLARENAMRSPKRTARTGGALMVGVALVIAITVIAASTKDWVRDAIGEQFSGDFVANTNTWGFGGLPPEVAAELNALPEVAAAAGIRIGAAHDVAAAKDIRYVAVDPHTVNAVFDIGVVEGDVEAISPDGLFVDDSVASRRALQLGDEVEFRFLDGSARTLTVEGVYTDDELAGDYVVTHALHEKAGGDQFDLAVYIATVPGIGDADARAAIAAVTDRFPNADLESRTEYIDNQAAQIDPLLNLMYGLLGLAVIIALVNIANSMALSIHERTREVGLLRAVGMTRGQTRASVRWEALLITLLGVGLGLVLGAFFGWSISVTVRDDGLATFTFPGTPVVIISLIAVAGGVLAAVRPAWRAARLNVLAAIAHE